MIAVTCPSCGKSLEIPEEYRGQTGNCRACGCPIAVPKSSLPPVPRWKLGCLYVAIGCGAMVVLIAGILGPPTEPSARPMPNTNTAARQPETSKPEAPPIGFTGTHRTAVEGAFSDAGIVWPYRILPNFDGVLFIEVTMPDDGPENLEDLAKALILSTRNAVYEIPGSVPDWWYNIKFYGPPPGPGLANLVGTCTIDHHGKIEWKPTTRADYTPSRPATAYSVATPQVPTLVYLAPKGKKYHAAHCSTVRSGSTAVQAADARAHGYQACKVCKPKS